MNYDFTIFSAATAAVQEQRCEAVTPHIAQSS